MKRRRDFEVWQIGGIDLVADGRRKRDLAAANRSAIEDARDVSRLASFIEQRGGMRAKAAHLTGAGAFEIPAIAAGPQRHLALFASHIGFEEEVVIARPASGQFADFRTEALAGLQAFFIEALAPERVVEERVDVGGSVQVSA